MSDYIEKGAIKVVELIGISPESFEDAVQQAVSKASVSLKGVTGVEVVKQSCRVKGGKIVEYHANLKLAFTVL